MTAPPLFKIGDRVRANYLGEWHVGTITDVHVPAGYEERYWYDFRGDAPSVLVTNQIRPECFELLTPLVPTPLVPMAKDLTLRELLIIQFLPDAWMENRMTSSDREAVMRTCMGVAAGKADLYLEARTKVGGAV